MRGHQRAGSGFEYQPACHDEATSDQPCPTAERIENGQSRDENSGFGGVPIGADRDPTTMLIFVAHQNVSLNLDGVPFRVLPHFRYCWRIPIKQLLPSMLGISSVLSLPNR